MCPDSYLWLSFLMRWIWYIYIRTNTFARKYAAPTWRIILKKKKPNTSPPPPPKKKGLNKRNKRKCGLLEWSRHLLIKWQKNTVTLTLRSVVDHPHPHPQNGQHQGSLHVHPSIHPRGWRRRPRSFHDHPFPTQLNPQSNRNRARPPATSRRAAASRATPRPRPSSFLLPTGDFIAHERPRSPADLAAFRRNYPTPSHMSISHGHCLLFSFSFS